MGRAGFAFSLSIKGLEVSAGGTWRTVLHPCNSRPANQGRSLPGTRLELFQRRDSFPRRRRETLCAKARTALAVYRRRDRAGRQPSRSSPCTAAKAWRRRSAQSPAMAR